MQSMVRGTTSWKRNNMRGWANAMWTTNTVLSGCADTGANKCGDAPLLTIERSSNYENQEEFNAVREGTKVYYSILTPNEERCRLKANLYSITCCSN